MRWPVFDKPPTRDLVWGWISLLFFLPLATELSPLLLLYALGVLGVRWRYGPHESGALYLALLFAGLGLIVLEFLREFTFVSLSQASVFITSVASLLTVGVVMMVLQGKRSFYLDISPAMFWVLSFFYHEHLGMLLYSIGALFIALTLLLWVQMRGSFGNAARQGTLFVMATLPVVVLLFALFPRIHFAKADFGFKDKHAKRMGHDGKMQMDDDAVLIPSKRIVMEVGFDDVVPEDGALYFRGSVLYREVDGLWLPAPARREVMLLPGQTLAKANRAVDYRITLYPHHKQWVYTLDMPGKIPKKVHADEDGVLRTEKPLLDIYIYSMRSFLEYATLPQLSPLTKRLSLMLDPQANPRTVGLVQELTRGMYDDRMKAERLLAFFGANGFRYTLKPERLEERDRIDSFLFDAKKGYCVHYSAAFVTMARMAGIPARVVTGFKASRNNSVENYLVVREEDAHAWVELFFEEEGWTRIDPTAQVVLQADGEETENVAENIVFGRTSGQLERFNLYWMYWRYQVEQWVLYYSRYKQHALLESIRQNSMVGFVIGGIFLLIVLVSMASAYILRRYRCNDASLCAMQRLWKVLGREGLHKKAGESAASFLRRMGREDPERSDTFLTLAKTFEEWRYGGNAPQEPLLQNLMKKLERR